MRSERKLHQCTFIRARISSFWRMRISSYFYLSERRWRCHDDEGERRRWKQDTKAESWKWGRSREIVQLSANQNWTRLKASSTIRSQTRKKFFFLLNALSTFCRYKVNFQEKPWKFILQIIFIDVRELASTNVFLFLSFFSFNQAM